MYDDKTKLAEEWRKMCESVHRMGLPTPVLEPGRMRRFCISIPGHSLITHADTMKTGIDQMLILLTGYQRGFDAAKNQ